MAEEYPECAECKKKEKYFAEAYFYEKTLRKELQAENKHLSKALGRAVQGYRNLIELKILPHVGWDEDTEKYISEIEQILEGGGSDGTNP